MDAPNPGNSIIVIPARLVSARLPGKPLADICGEPMIVHVWRRAIAAKIGPVLVAAAESEIASVIQAVGGDAIMTDPDLPSGSDRIAQALELRDPKRRFSYVVNLQGDLPSIAPEIIRCCLVPLSNEHVDIATLAAQIKRREEIGDPNVVKAIAPLDNRSGTALASDFLRELPDDAEPPFWHHVGVYAYRRTALEVFVSLPVSEREAERRLEQMRALDNGMRIAVTRIGEVPIGVDTATDLDRARNLLKSTG